MIRLTSADPQLVMVWLVQPHIDADMSKAIDLPDVHSFGAFKDLYRRARILHVAWAWLRPLLRRVSFYNQLLVRRYRGMGAILPR